MSAPAALRRLLVYDGDCPLCRRAAAWLERSGLAPGTRCAAWQALDPPTAQRAAEAGFRNEMAVLDLASGEPRTGVRGLLWALDDGPVGPLARILAAPALRRPLDLVYRTVAYNRRVLAPPPTPGLACACDPDEHRGYQWALIVALGATVVACVAVFAAASARLGDLGPSVRNAALAAIAGGWLPTAVAGLALSPDPRMRWWGHLAVTAASASLWLLPLAVLARISPPDVLSPLVGVGLLGMLGLGWRALRRRVALTGLGPRWTRGTTLSLLSGAAAALALLLARS